MLTPSPAEGYSLSPSAARGLKLHIFVGISKFFRRIFFHFVPQNTTDIPYQTRSVEFLKPPKQANSEYPQNINKQKLPVSDTELIVSCFGTEGLNSTVAARLRGISAS